MNVQEYSVALISTSGSQKTPNSIANEIGVSQSTVSRFLSSELDINQNLIEEARQFYGNKKVDLIVDDTSVSRRHSRFVEGVSTIIDQTTKSFAKGYKIITAGLTDGRSFMPIIIDQLIPKELSEGEHLSLIQVTKNLILKIIKLNFSIQTYLFDGLFFSDEFVCFLNQLKLGFIMKAKTTTKFLFQGKFVQARNCPALRLNSNQSAKKTVASWNGNNFHFVAVHRTGKHGTMVIYLISNTPMKSKRYAKLYGYRWKIEKFHRTVKQSLGFGKCFSTKSEVYMNHIKAAGLAYCRLQKLMKKFKLKSAEEAIRYIQAQKNILQLIKKHDPVSFSEIYA
jgi:hypothetical protein